MNQLRKLAKGYRRFDSTCPLVVCESGIGSGRVWREDLAPAECFAEAEKLKVGDRVAVVDEPTRPEGGTSLTDEGWSGRHGTLRRIEPQVGRVDFGDGKLIGIWLYNLRRERPDERPDEKPEPPQRKYEDGQWLETRSGFKGCVSDGGLPGVARLWVYRFWGEDGHKSSFFYESKCKPCPPPLSDAQRRLQPGDMVCVRDRCWDDNGKPVKSKLCRQSYEILILDNDTPRKIVRATLGSIPFSEKEWLHNLEPASESAPKAVPEQ